MLTLTLRVIQGADRGKVFADIKPPLTIGREEGNTIQLNDERVSRFHVKIQEDNNHLVLTDLESTNGTRVNGQDCQLRILRYGDIVSVGRSVLLYGTREQIASRVQQNLENFEAQLPESASAVPNFDDPGFDLSTGLMSSFKILATHQPIPVLPERMSPSQSAQLSEILDYFHFRMSNIVEEAHMSEKGDEIRLDPSTWQLMLQLHSRLAEFVRSLGDPDHKISN
jgi:pSer/pThr/pTyr-binding forkhead associated (FHA) protein